MTKQKVKNRDHLVQGSRLESIDMARGLIMVLMALDHVRIYFSQAQFSPTDLDETNLGLFLIRWITHFCAPGFFFLAGISVFYIEQKSKSKIDVCKFLISRGLWLIFLELTVIGFAWSFIPGWNWLGVIWSLGLSFFCMAIIIFLSKKLVLYVSLAFLIFHPVIFGPMMDALTDYPDNWLALLYAGGGIYLESTGIKIVLYSLLPWLTIMSFGYGIAGWLTGNRDDFANKAIILGMVSIFTFILLRATNLYGDLFTGFPPRKSGEFIIEGGFVRSIMSFLNTDKYPASPQFLLMTLGPLFLLIGMSEKKYFKLKTDWLKIKLIIFGKVPFFYYILHLYVIHGLAIILANITGQPHTHLYWDGSRVPPDHYGYNEVSLVGIWLFIVILLYFPSRWFLEIKRKSDRWWVRYL